VDLKPSGRSDLEGEEMLAHTFRKHLSASTGQRIQSRGLDALPGGGAEVFSERVRKALFPFKIGAPRWMEIHKAAHRLGIPTNATLLYGHIETPAERVDHMIRMRELQDETGGFTAFIPLAFQVDNNRLSHLPKVTAQTDIKVHAVARLMMDNIDHIKAYWVMIGLKMAQILLSYGADDIDGTILEERIVHMAGAESPLGVSEEELRALIHEAGRDPVRRDTLYRSLEPAGFP
jgi:aminodeoxyfutalosine synthase